MRLDCGVSPSGLPTKFYSTCSVAAQPFAMRMIDASVTFNAEGILRRNICDLTKELICGPQGSSCAKDISTHLDPLGNQAQPRRDRGKANGSIGLSGERGRTRTCDPCLKRALLYQLSYAPTPFQSTLTSRILHLLRRPFMDRSCDPLIFNRHDDDRTTMRSARCTPETSRTPFRAAHEHIRAVPNCTMPLRRSRLKTRSADDRIGLYEFRGVLCLVSERQSRS
jgi:hypothetical protein